MLSGVRSEVRVNSGVPRHFTSTPHSIWHLALPIGTSRVSHAYLPPARQRSAQAAHGVPQRDGSLHAEELIGNKGFTGPSSLLYHLHQPTPVRAVRTLRDLQWQRDPERQFRHRHFRTHQLGSGGSLTLDRIPLLFNARRRDVVRAARSRGRLLLPQRAGRRGGLRQRGQRRARDAAGRDRRSRTATTS